MTKSQVIKLVRKMGGRPTKGVVASVVDNDDLAIIQPVKKEEKKKGLFSSSKKK